MEKSWREATPKWAVEAAEKEMAALKRRLSLRWPDEARPEAVDFQWGAYDALRGSPIAGKYYYVSSYGSVATVEIREKNKEDKGWKNWRFRENNSTEFGENVVRGPLYSTEKEAMLHGLWEACDRAAETLEKVWSKYQAQRGYV